LGRHGLPRRSDIIRGSPTTSPAGNVHNVPVDNRRVCPQACRGRTCWLSACAPPWRNCRPAELAPAELHGIPVECTLAVAQARLPAGHIDPGPVGGDRGMLRSYRPQNCSSPARYGSRSYRVAAARLEADGYQPARQRRRAQPRLQLPHVPSRRSVQCRSARTFDQGGRSRYLLHQWSAPLMLRGPCPADSGRSCTCLLPRFFRPVRSVRRR
jgi:hypothetical protein